MSKVTLTNPATFVSDATAVAQVTVNNAALTAAIENTLSRDGTSPNSMNAPLDMNSQKIINLPVASSPTEPVRLNEVGNAPAYAAAALADRILADADVVLTHADVTLTHADVVLTHADVVATHADVVSAAGVLASSLLKANNLSDLASTVTAKSNLGLNNVDNTSDVNKPVSTAQSAALALKAPLASPALTGVPTAPTAAANTNNTQLASTAYADAAVSTLSGTVNTALALKAPLASPALTGTPTAPTATVGTNTTQLATTAFVLANGGGSPAVVAPLGDAAVAAVGVSTLYARQDHVHPGREKLVANRNCYVRTDGNDSNNGLVNNAGGAFLTLQAALNYVVSNIDFSGWTVIIQAGQASQSWTANVTFNQPWTGGGSLIIDLAAGTWAVPGNYCFVQTAPLPGSLTIQNATITGATGGGVYQGSTGTISFGAGITFAAGAVGFYHMTANVAGGLIQALTSYTISGAGVSAHQLAIAGAQINSAGVTVTFTAKGTFSSAFAYASRQGFLNVNANVYKGSVAVTMTIASPAVVSWTAHPFVANDPIIFQTTGALPTGVTAGVCYFVSATGLTANSFQFSATAGGASIISTGSQSGVHTIVAVAGTRYTVDNLGIIFTNGAGVNYFPGSVVGVGTNPGASPYGLYI